MGTSAADRTVSADDLFLAPDIQERLILQVRGAFCDDFHRMVDFLTVSGEAAWGKQRVMLGVVRQRIPSHNS